MVPKHVVPWRSLLHPVQEEGGASVEGGSPPTATDLSARCHGYLPSTPPRQGGLVGVFTACLALMKMSFWTIMLIDYAVGTQTHLYLLVVALHGMATLRACRLCALLV